MGLNDEIKQRRAEIFSDGYSMSVGELISMYESDELNIRPQFQRFFRWTEYQRSRLIESLLLKIPIPSIFVSQREDGVWDVIDGQQRLSTIFQLVGVLKDEDDRRLDPLKMTRTKFLPSLADKAWDGIGRDNQLLIKRSKIDVRIILRESSDVSQYELFQRLNTGGSQLSDQEMRNVIMIMVDPSFYEWIETLAEDENFRSCTLLTDRARDERYDLELVMRFMALYNRDESLLNVGDIGSFLDDQAEYFAKMAKKKSFDRVSREHAFSTTFRILFDNYGDDIFRRYDRGSGRHLGGFLISAFEVFAIGMGWHLKDSKAAVDKDRLVEIVESTWSDSDFLNRVGSGISASRRIPVVIPYARKRLEQCLTVPHRN